MVATRKSLIFLCAIAISTTGLAQIYQGAPKPGSPLVKYNSISQDFGVPWSVNPAQVHTGLDLTTPKGNRVFSIKQGVVVKTGSLGGSYGNFAVIMNRDGTINGYLHLNLSVSNNQKVKPGQEIGTIFKDHLHLNQCKQVDGCQNGAFPNPTYAKLPVSRMPDYYVRPRI